MNRLLVLSALFFCVVGQTNASEFVQIEAKWSGIVKGVQGSQFESFDFFDSNKNRVQLKNGFAEPLVWIHLEKEMLIDGQHRCLQVDGKTTTKNRKNAVAYRVVALANPERCKGTATRSLDRQAIKVE